MGQEDKTGKLKQKARPKKSMVKGTESEAGQAAVKHGVKQRENPEQKVESIELIDKQVKEKEETLRQKQHEIKLMMEKEILRSYAQPNIQQEKMLRKLKRNYARQLKLLDQIKDLNDLRSPGKEGPLQRGEKPNVKRQKKEKSGDGVKRGHLTCGDCGVQGCFGPCNWCGRMLCDYCTSDHYWWHTTGRNH